MGVALLSATEAFDSGTPSGQFFMTTLAGIASLERSTIQERTMLGKRRRLAEGRWAMGGQPPLGYSRNGEGYLQIEPEEADIVRTIFRLYTEEGMTTTSIADYLTAKEVPVSAVFKNTHKGHRGVWLPARVSTILANPTYVGRYRPLHQHGEGVPLELKVPAIISEEVWRKAEALRHRNKAGGFKADQRPYLLRGLMRCGRCNLAYVGSSPGRRSRPYSYYRCGCRQAPKYLRPNGNRVSPTRSVPMAGGQYRAYMRRTDAPIGQDVRLLFEDESPEVKEDLSILVAASTAEREGREAR